MQPQGSSVIKLFDMTAVVTGINELQANAIRLKYEKVILSPLSHTPYYPNGKVMTMKVLFETQIKKILGAQIVGFDGVDKRIDVIATSIRAGMSIPTLIVMKNGKVTSKSIGYKGKDDILAMLQN